MDEPKKDKLKAKCVYDLKSFCIIPERTSCGSGISYKQQLCYLTLPEETSGKSSVLFADVNVSTSSDRKL